jgi:hypothetical protein
VPRLEQSGQREVVCASVTATGNQKLHRLHRFFSMPESGRLPSQRGAMLIDGSGPPTGYSAQMAVFP